MSDMDVIKLLLGLNTAFSLFCMLWLAAIHGTLSGLIRNQRATNPTAGRGEG